MRTTLDVWRAAASRFGRAGAAESRRLGGVGVGAWAAGRTYCQGVQRSRASRPPRIGAAQE